jgi:Mg-chelatase subunit ChlD
MHRQHRRQAARIALYASIAAVAVVPCCLPFSSVIAQSIATAPQLTAGPTYTSNDGNTSPKFPDVDIVFRLARPDGVPIAAKPTELKLFSQRKEIGTATSIRSFEQAGYGVTAILALDASGSMKGAPLNDVHASIAKFVDQARPQDKVAVMTFADKSRVDVPFGSSQSVLANELKTVQARGKFTRLYDGLLDAMAQFGANQPKRRQLVVISDGHDEGSQHAITDVLVRARSMGVVIDCIGLTRDNGEYLISLQQLSRETAGNYRRAQSAYQLEGLIGQGIQAMRSTPVATITTSHLSADDTVQSTQLRWLPGNLSTTAFIRTPKSDPVRSPWVWTLGACFISGVILLLLSLIGSRRKQLPPAHAGTAHTGAPTPNLPPIAPSPAAHRATALERTNTPRTPTRPESISVATQIQQPPENSTHAITQFAVFFDADAKGPYATLEIRSGYLNGETISVTAVKFNIGAAADNHLILPGDLTISGYHASLFWEDAVLKIEDANSTNGTFVNSIRLVHGRHLLRPGDKIGIGQTTLVARRA